MSTLYVNQIFSAFAASMTILNTNLLGNLAIKWPNRDFTPPQGAPYLGCDIVVNDVEVRTLGTTGEDDVTGFFQISLYFPENKGNLAAAQCFDTLKRSFVIGFVARYGTASADVTGVQWTTMTKQGSFYTGFVTVYWKSRIARAMTESQNYVDLLAGIAGYTSPSIETNVTQTGTLISSLQTKFPGN